MPGRVLLREIIEWTYLSQEVLNELAIEVSEAEKSPNVLEVAGFRSVGDSGGFTIVHTYTIGLDDHAEILDAVIVKLTFLRL